MTVVNVVVTITVDAEMFRNPEGAGAPGFAGRIVARTEAAQAALRDAVLGAVGEELGRRGPPYLTYLDYLERMGGAAAAALPDYPERLRRAEPGDGE